MHLRIAILTKGRFHVLDLARELATLGHEVAFYSYVPKRRAMRFGLPARCHRSLLPYVAPLVALQRFGPKRFRTSLDNLMHHWVDSLAAHMIEPCDVFIGMSGLAVKSAYAARRKFGARVLIERGSRHILSQKEILDAIPAASRKRDTVPAYAVQRELASYEAADIIVIPSHHVEESFVERGVARTKLFRNPYGVDLAMFPPTPAPPATPPCVLFVGGWSFRKGCDLLTNAWRWLDGVRLLHVGGIADAPLPTDPGFAHHGPVPQWRLSEFYGKAHVFCLASREEGLSLVQAQALASGLPVVCTDRTGGEDLREFLDDPRWVTVVPTDNAAALAAGIKQALGLAASQQGIRDILGPARARLSWQAYGERYERFLNDLLSGRMRV